MDNFMVKNIAIIGGSGALGSAFTEHLSTLHKEAIIHNFSRDDKRLNKENIAYHTIDYQNEAAIESAATIASKEGALDLVIVATGILHNAEIMPEKSLKELSAEKFRHLFEINTILPALVVKHFAPKMNKESRSVFAALSARVGSISDNHLGGWYSYRASKAALNMVLKSASIEVARRNHQAIIIGLHPGTVESSLSEPFKTNVAEGKLFTPEFSVQKMIEILESLTAESSGKCFAWDGKEIQP